jgi:phospholipid/cholesterol/gamma-HCH transport system substrate-binding protein
MVSRAQEVLLGGVVFVAIVIVVVGTVWLSEQFAGAAGGYRLHVKFDSVPGLQRGNALTIRGVRVGKVLKVELKGGQPVVTLGFADRTTLPRDSKILLKSEGLLGGQMIEIQVGSTVSNSYANGDTVRGISGSGLAAVMNNAASMAEQLNEAVSQTMNKENIEHIQRVLSDVDSASTNLKAILDENRSTIANVLDSLAVASGDAREMIGENRPEIRKAVASLRRSSERLAALSKNLVSSSVSLKELLDNLNQITGKIRNGEGTLGKLVQDGGVYDNLQRTLSTVDSLVSAIKKEPKKYLNVDLHIF